METKIEGVPINDEPSLNRTILSNGGEDNMKRFAAHAIIYVKYDDGNQNNYPVWEHVYLVNAVDFDTAEVEAKTIVEGHLKVIAELTCEGRPAHLTFVGIRKVIEINPPDNKLDHGIEITYSQFEVENDEQLHMLACGESVPVIYEDDVPDE
jgi:hypothetical protein